LLPRCCTKISMVSPFDRRPAKDNSAHRYNLDEHLVEMPNIS
jgi:hypothetical protein